MRKAMIAVLLLLIISVSGMCGIFLAINDTSDRVQLTEQVRYGDRSVAEGLTVGLRTHYNHELRWDTTYQVGEEAKTDTEYYYFATGFEVENQPYSGVEMSTYVDYGFDFVSDEDDVLTGLGAAYQELYDSMEPGEYKSKVICPKDYMDYYPVQIVIDLPLLFLVNDFMGDYDEVQIRQQLAKDWESGIETALKEVEKDSDAYTLLKMMDFFKIPILEEETLEISIEKGVDGVHYTGSGAAESDNYCGFSVSTFTEDACYFTFNTKTAYGNEVDTSLIPGGYGIYKLPYITEPAEYPEPEKCKVKVDELDMVYPLNPEIDIQYLSVNQEQTKLLMYTIENEKYILTIIDIATMATLQRIELCDYSEETAGLYICDGEAFVGVLLGDKKLVVLSVTETGAYQLDFVTDVELVYEKRLVNYIGYTVAMDYDGEKLALCYYTMDEEDFFEGCDFGLAVYDETGLLYYGEYENSLGVGNPMGDYGYTCKPTDFDGLWVKWEK